MMFGQLAEEQKGKMGTSVKVKVAAFDKRRG